MFITAAIQNKRKSQDLKHSVVLIVVILENQTLNENDIGIVHFSTTY